jgi:hypothetical protein
MPATQSQPKFTAQEAERFAALMAGFDTGNPSEAEAVGKIKALRRMASAAGLRVIDALELPEIREAIDGQMQPMRHQGDVSELQAENDDLKEKLSEVVPRVTGLARELHSEKAMSWLVNHVGLVVAAFAMGGGAYERSWLLMIVGFIGACVSWLAIYR